MFKHTQYSANGTEQDDLANDKVSTLAVLADNEQWVADNYNKTITISEQDRSKFAALTAEGRYSPAMSRGCAYYAMEYTAG
jgi:hypothetical protein